MYGIIQRFVAIRLPILACLLNSIKLIQRIINIVFEKNIVNKIDRIILAVDFHFCITETVVITRHCCTGDIENFVRFLVYLARQLECCSGLEVRKDDCFLNIVVGAFRRLDEFRHRQHINTLSSVAHGRINLHDCITIMLQLSDSTAQVHTDFVRIHNGATVILR